MVRSALLRPSLLIACAALLFLAGCSAIQTPKKPLPQNNTASIEWPVGEEGGRITWVKTIAEFGEVKEKPGFWSRVATFFTGQQDTTSIARPYGVLHGRGGRLYVADAGGGMVHCLDLLHGSYTTIGKGELVSPIGLAEDDLGRLYITDSARATVYRWEPASQTLKPFLEKTLARPTGIAYSEVNKLLYISDTLASQVVAVDQNGIVRRRLGGPSDGGSGFNRPTDITVDSIGEILVTDSLNFRIIVLTPEGQLVRQFGAVGDARGYFSRPKGIGVDSDKHTYVCDSLRDAVQVFDADGTPLLVFGKGGDGPGRFWMPSGIYVDSNDYIFVADTYNRRIQVFRYTASQELR
ncbi:MAG TPA: 6-bladed beta-propeller [Geomonas sp.]|nr:6-bladed beta-propeller [Geomonas sp.]